MPYTLDQVKVLVVDDMKPMLALTTSVLKTFGFKDIIVAESGQEGFENFCRFNPELVITDWIMEPMDGLEMTQKIRTDERSPNKFVPIIVMTGFSAQKRVESSRDKGITEFLVKPFNADDLYKRICQVIEKPRQFVDSNGFFGPDRRRRSDSEYGGPRRRELDTPDVDYEVTGENVNILRKLKEEAKTI